MRWGASSPVSKSKAFLSTGDLLIEELQERFNQTFLKPLIAIETTIIAAANGKEIDAALNAINGSVFAKDFHFSRLPRQLAILPDIVHQALPEVKQVTSAHAVCTTMATACHSKTFG